MRKAALATYHDFWLVIDDLGRDSSKDWTLQVESVSAGDVRDELLATAKGAADQGQRFTGHD